MNIKKLLAIFAAVFVSGFVSSNAYASHFRFGHITWKLISANQQDGSFTVEFTSIQAWRATADDTLPINYGDGGSTDSSVIANRTVLGPFTDIGGEQYVITRYTDLHTYANVGPWVADITSCCRIGSLINAGDDSELVQTIVDLSNSNAGSPVSSIPVILQMAQGQINSITLPIADPQGEPTNCRMATADESFISSLATAGGLDLEVSNNCVLSWDTTGTAIGQKYAAQVVIEESNRCGLVPNGGGSQSTAAAVLPVCASVALDFIIEIVDGNPPTCTSDKPVNNIIPANVPFSANFTGTDIDPGEVLTVTDQGLPAGSVLTPATGTTQAAPFAVNFSWTPTDADVNSAVAFVVTFTDSNGLQNTCTMSLQIIENIVCNETDYQASITGIDGNALALSSSYRLLTKRAVKLGAMTKKQAKKNRELAQALYIQAWKAINSIPTKDVTCNSASVACTSVATSGLVEEVHHIVHELVDLSLEIKKLLKKKAGINKDGFTQEVLADISDLDESTDALLESIPANLQQCEV